ncbi:uncharacterized protein LOC105443706 [Strongylocentrotus purpuratus]|uniref:Sulfotransferase domain-containing protein n=1 Tax=Strongylocentrotus purpuratus TaxID=7668 RepID=A0A7M7PMA2_STRPU|nr:uncharacterized protein LOC105443706 [Strongylocentrotus purpuratus]
MAAWKIRDEKNVLFLFFEDVKRDPKKCIQQVAEFLGGPLSEEAQQRILEKSSFEGMGLTYKKLADDAAKSGKADPTRIDGKRGYIKKEPPSAYCCKVFDGAVIVHCLPDIGFSTFNGYANEVFIPYLEKQL